MKICLINNLFKPYERGGADRIVENIYQGLNRRGYETFTISLRPYFSKIKKNSDHYYIPSIFFNLKSIPKFFRFFYHFWDFVNFINLLRIALIFQKQKPDLVITNNLKGVGYLTFWLLHVLSIKNIHILHDIQLIHPSGLIIYGKENKFKSIFTGVYSFLSRKISASPLIVISPSKWLLSKHAERGFFKKSKQLVLQNPVKFSNGEFSSLPNKKRFNKFLYVGEIKEHKGVDFLISAFTCLLKRDKNFHLSVVGRDSEKIKIPQELAGNFRLLGWKSEAEVKLEMAECDCLIVPSLCYENSPTVIYEAAASALPVIASRIGGISELVHSLGGILFQPGREDDFLKKIIYAQKNPDIMRKIGIRASQKIKNYNLEKYLDILEEEVKKIS